jgi:hypothetical protein
VGGNELNFFVLRHGRENWQIECGKWGAKLARIFEMPLWFLNKPGGCLYDKERK